MARPTLLLMCLHVLGACATPADEVKTMSVPQICYRGATQWEYRRAADEELKRRGEVCENYREQILAIHKREVQARATPTGVGPGPERSIEQPIYINTPPPLR